MRAVVHSILVGVSLLGIVEVAGCQSAGEMIGYESDEDRYIRQNEEHTKRLNEQIKAKQRANCYSGDVTRLGRVLKQLRSQDAGSKLVSGYSSEDPAERSSAGLSRLETLTIWRTDAGAGGGHGGGGHGGGGGGGGAGGGHDRVSDAYGCPVAY
jgi:hypothetical protein